MRLRLEVQRYQLPSLKLLWQAEPDQTIAELLSSVDASVPLESQDWSLEDYVLQTADGFETLHYQTVESILKEDEHVTIRPLSSADVRRQRIMGRTSIHPSGARLLDGVVYGRPMLRKPMRPELRIASRERIGFGSAVTLNALSDDEDGEEGEEDDIGHDDYDEDENYESGGDDDADSGEDSEDEEYPPGTVITIQKGRVPNRRKSVSWKDNESMDDTQPQLLLENGTTETIDSLVHSADLAVDGSGEPMTKASKSKKRQAASENPGNTTAMLSHASERPSKRAKLAQQGHDTESIATSEEYEDEESPPADVAQPRPVPPGHGMSKTKNRNKRRTINKKLNRLKASGQLPDNANKDDMVKYLEGLPNGGTKLTNGRDYTTSPEASTSESSQSEFSQSESSTDDSSSESDSDVSDSDSSSGSDSEDSSSSSSGSEPSILTSRPTADQGEEFQARRQALLDALATGGVDITPEAAAMSPAQEQRKARLDVSASQRMLLGSLGHRAPRSAEERAALVAKVDAQGRRKQPAQQVETKEPIATHPDFWKEHIDLSAVECLNEDIELSTPPFPFRQRWDPSQQTRKRRRHQEEETVVLDYDDPVEFDGFEDSVIPAEDDLPPLPEDLTTLPLATEADVLHGTVLVFSNLEVSAATNWTPSTVGPRTAQVLNEAYQPGQTVLLQLALRDQPERLYDDDGNRVYEKFEMAADEEDEGVLELGWCELLEPRVLAGAGALVSEEDHADVQW